jgi:hypothetical protein
MKKNQLNYKVDPSKWEFATLKWLKKLFFVLKRQLQTDIKITRARKVIENKFKMSAFQIYFGLTKQRYNINKNIRDHKVRIP